MYRGHRAEHSLGVLNVNVLSIEHDEFLRGRPPMWHFFARVGGHSIWLGQDTEVPSRANKLS